jgi:hypothetical protein
VCGVARFDDLRGERGWNKNGSPDGGADEFPASYVRALICHYGSPERFLSAQELLHCGRSSVLIDTADVLQNVVSVSAELIVL